MENDKEASAVQMGFVMPKDIAVDASHHQPAKVSTFANESAVDLLWYDSRANSPPVRQRVGSQAANLDGKQGASRRRLLDSSGVETAGYDPPFTPGPLRRNEVLIR